MSVIMDAARIQGKASINRRARAWKNGLKYHLWGLSTGEVILLKQTIPGGFQKAVKIDTPFEVILNRFLDKRGYRVFCPTGV
ncbi:hypothetical protein D3C78_1691190 [compost metagenome]